MSGYGESGFGVEPYAGDETTGGGGGISGTRVQQWTPYELGGQTYHAGPGVVFDNGVFSLEEVLQIVHGGTDATYVGGATTNLGIVTSYVDDLPALSAGVPCLVLHGLGTTNVGVQFRTTDDNEEISMDWAALDDNTITVYSGIDFAASAVRVEAVA